MPDASSDAVLHAYLSYADAGAAIEWLTALGFEVLTRYDIADGRVGHCELRLGDAVIMVASNDEDYDVPALRGVSVGLGSYLQTSDVDELHRRAVTAKGRSVLDPHDTEWGTRRARVLDPGGREWSFGSYRPGRVGG